MQPEASTTLVVLDLVGIFVFAISGALVAVRKDLDVFGVLVLAGTTGLGGGFLRDVLIDATPPAALEDWRYLLVPVAAGLVTFVFHPALGRMERLVNIFDAFGLALFCVTGALKALDYGLDPAAGRADGDGHRHRRRHGSATCSPAGCRSCSAASSTPRRRWPAPRSRSSAPTTSTSRSVVVALLGGGRLPGLAAAGHVAGLAGPDADGARQRLSSSPPPSVSPTGQLRSASTTSLERPEVGDVRACTRPSGTVQVSSSIGALCSASAASTTQRVGCRASS